jgi:hypothetical protein
VSVTEKPTRIPPYRVDLGKSGREWIVFDYDGAFFRVAYYRPWREGDTRRGDYSRFSAQRSTFHQALLVAFGEGNARHDASVIEHYVRSTAWGADLPE